MNKECIFTLSPILAVISGIGLLANLRDRIIFDYEPFWSPITLGILASFFTALWLYSKFFRKRRSV